jgi:hypothetical protein
MLIGAQSAMAMQLPSYWSAIKPEPATLAGVPTELKQYLLPFVASGDPKKAAESILALAQVDKAFRSIINNEDTMLALLNGLSDAKAVITFIEQLQKYSDIFPVMNRPVIITRLEDAKQSLINPEEVARAAQLRQQRIANFINYAVPTGYMIGTYMMWKAIGYVITEGTLSAIAQAASHGNTQCMDFLWTRGLFEAISDIVKCKGLTEEEGVKCVNAIIEFAIKR